MKSLRGVKPKPSKDRDPLRRVPPAPSYFNDYAKDEWRRVMSRLVEDGIVTKADLGGIEDLCIARAYVRQIEEARTRAGGAIHPKLFGVLNRAMQTSRQLAAEYGLSPVSRARIASQRDDDDDTDNPLTVR